LLRPGAPMIGPAALVVGVLFTAAVHLLMASDVQRVVIGFLLLSNAVNLLVLTAGGTSVGAAPPLIVEGEASPYADPLPQAFILTAIVIGLGSSAFLLAMAVGVQATTGSDRLDGGAP